MPEHLAPEVRTYYLAAAPARAQQAIWRVHHWAETSTNVRDKLAVDDLLTYVAGLISRVTVLEQECAAHGYSVHGEDVDDFDDEREEGDTHGR